ncbi:MAG TPA: tetratricopeptide repeat protein [Pyrinomonadaceae bacterium]|nr:tetratricopeptide repeat protein [Pyrinomonadaceae bacterium]
MRLVALPLIAIISCLAWNYYHRSPERKSIVLLAGLQSQGAESVQATEMLLEQLRLVARQSDEFEVQSVPDVISEEAGTALARAKGRERKAAIVVWGQSDGTGEGAQVKVHFEILHKNNVFRSVEGKEALSAAPARFESFTVQGRLSEQSSYLRLITAGLLHFDKQNFKDAIASFTEALSRQDESAPAANLSPVYLYRGIASLYLYRTTGERQRIDDAIEDYNRLLELNPDDAMAYFNRAIAYCDKGDYELALADCDRVLNLKSDYAEAFFLRGSLFSERGEYARAIADFDRTLALRRNDAVAYSLRGDAYTMLGDLNHAIADYSETIRLKPGAVLAFYNRGKNYAQKGEQENALADFNQVLKLTRNDQQRQEVLQAIEELTK